MAQIKFASVRNKLLAERHPHVMAAEQNYADLVESIAVVREELRVLRAAGSSRSEQSDLKNKLIELREDRSAALDRVGLAYQHAILHPEDVAA